MESLSNSIIILFTKIIIILDSLLVHLNGDQWYRINFAPREVKCEEATNNKDGRDWGGKSHTNCSSIIESLPFQYPFHAIKIGFYRCPASVCLAILFLHFSSLLFLFISFLFRFFISLFYFAFLIRC